jgi:signal transduction histidine kinase
MRVGVGIYGIRARARHFGGDLKIRSGPRGTTIHVFLDRRTLIYLQKCAPTTAAFERPAQRTRATGAIAS